MLFCRKPKYTLHRARWLRGNDETRIRGPWFKSRCRPTWQGIFRGFPQSLCWVGLSLPRSIWPLFIKFIYHKIKISQLNKWNIDCTTIEIHKSSGTHPKTLNAIWPKIYTLSTITQWEEQYCCLIQLTKNIKRKLIKWTTERARILSPSSPPNKRF